MDSDAKCRSAKTSLKFVLAGGFGIGLLSLALISPFLSITRERWGSRESLDLKCGNVPIIGYVSKKNLTCVSVGTQYNGIIVGHNQYGFYGRAALKSNSKKWGTWLR